MSTPVYRQFETDTRAKLDTLYHEAKVARLERDLRDAQPRRTATDRWPWLSSTLEHLRVLAGRRPARPA